MTLQAPHSLAPQPKCGPVMRNGPRRVASSDESGSASTSVSTPLRRNRMLGIEKQNLDCRLTLLRLVGETLDDFSPFHDIAPQIFVELLPRHRHRRPTLFLPELYNVPPLDYLAHRGLQFVNHGLPRPRSRHPSKPHR